MTKFNWPDGATPLDDYSGLIPSRVITLSDLNRVEAENIAYAYMFYLTGQKQPSADWFNVTDLKKMHIAMFGKVWRWAGQFRKSVTSIGISPQYILPQLSELCFEVNGWEVDNDLALSFLERAARIHHKLVFIHPFENGNGRFSRLVSDRYLYVHDLTYAHWPDDLHVDSNVRDAYIQSLKAADVGDYEPLVSLMQKFGAGKVLD